MAAFGIADMVDKYDWFNKPSNAISDYARKYISDVKRTPYVIKSIDRLLLQITENKNRKAHLGKKIMSILPQRGHTTGYYMAHVILEFQKKRKLVNCVGNPFEFILLYNESAKKSRGKYPQFSQNSILLIESLYGKYRL